MSQTLRDALKRMRAEGEVWVNFGGERLHLARIDRGTAEERAPEVWNGWTVLAHTRKRRLVVGMIVSRKETATRPHLAEPFSVWLSWKNILARVVERHPRIVWSIKAAKALQALWDDAQGEDMTGLKRRTS